MPDSEPATATKPPTRTIGFWMSIPIAGLQAFNAVRAGTDPQGFAIYMGVPLAAAGDAAWVLVYALRTTFIALLVTVLLFRRDLHALKWTALVALPLPLGDAWVASQSGADAATIARHGAIGLYLALTTLALFLAARGRAR